MTSQNARRTPRIVSASVLGAIALLASVAHSADITWDTPQQITGPSDVSTTGTLIGAFNVGAAGVPSTTVNGVVFQSFSTTDGNGSAGNFTTSGSGFIGQTNTGHGSAMAPFSGLPAEYRTLLQSASVPFGGVVTLTISGLIVGTEYQFQWWANDSSTANGNTRATAGNEVELEDNTGPEGGLGEWVIGSFTADATTQNIAFAGDGDFGAFNGFQLRQVPEPGTTALLLVGLGGAVVMYRRQRRTR